MEIEELLGAYALNAVTAHERTVVKQHLSECAPCRAEVKDHHEVAGLLAGGPVQPAERVWKTILAQITEIPPVDEPAPVVSLARRRRWAEFTAAGRVASMAAAVAVLTLSAAVITQSQRIGDLNARLTAQERQLNTMNAAPQTDPLRRAAVAALENPAARVVNLAGEVNAGEALAVILPDGTAYVVESTLPELPQDATYQLWAVVDEKVISAGVLGSRPEIVPFHIDPEGLQGLVITREPAGGVPQSEADPVVAWFEA